MNEEQSTQSEQEDVIERTIQDAGSIGKVWARYGLLAGKSALQTSAATLDKLSGLLGHYASVFKEEEEQKQAEQEVIEANGEAVEGEERQ